MKDICKPDTLREEFEKKFIGDEHDYFGNGSKPIVLCEPEDLWGWIQENFVPREETKLTTP